MQFESFSPALWFLLWSSFGIALVLGAVVNKTNFCTMGAVSDWVNIGDKGRFRSWMLAIAMALLGVVILEYFGLIDGDGSFPPYRAGELIWAENLLGGLLFGVGMTLANGCANKTLVRLGGGNLKSLLVLLVIAVVAYFMTNPFPGTDQTLFSVLFYDWIRPLAIQTGGSQDLGSLLAAGADPATTRLVIGSVLGLGLLYLVFRNADFRRSGNNILAGVVVGVAVLAAWYVSSNVMINLDDENFSLQGYTQQWDFLSDSREGKPADSRPLAAQSFTFVNPMGQALDYSLAGFNSAWVTFGIMSLFGVVAGSFLWALFSRSFRFEWFASGRDFFNHLAGGALMGVGGVLALGCTVGQGITGVSTLAVGSFIALGGIVLGSALTMKIQYYKLVYEDEASFGAALLSALVDLHLLPARLRRLDAV